MTNKKILIVDTNSIAARAWGTPDIDRRPANYFSMVWKTLEWIEPTHFCLCFDDPDSRSFRYDRYPGYKAGRQNDPARQARIVFVNCLARAYQKAGFDAIFASEADDAIASVVAQARLRKWETVIFSADQDMFGLVTDNPPPVTVVGFRRDEAGRWERYLIGPPQVRHKLGVWPHQVWAYKALAGDSSDKIPGAHGCGPQKAKKLLQSHKHLRGILSHEDSGWLWEQKARIDLSLELATPVNDLPVGELEDFKLPSREDFSRAVQYMLIDLKGIWHA